MAENKLVDLSTDFAVKTLKMTDDMLKDLSHDCGAIRRMLIFSVNTTKENVEKKANG